MTFIQSWGGVFSESLLNLWYGFMNFVPNLLGAIILFIIGWIIGSVVGKAIKQIISALKIDRLFDGASAREFMNRSGLKISVGGFLGGLVKWFIIVVFLMASLQIIGLTQVNDFLSTAVLFYLPKVIIAALVLIIATVIADAMKKLVVTSAKAANISSANMLGSIVKYAIWIFAFIIALSELGIAAAFMQILFTGLIAGLAIAFGLSFGLGGKEAASRALQNISNDISSRM
jgi:small-conductance mechanosensitive channel